MMAMRVAVFVTGLAFLLSILYPSRRILLAIWKPEEFPAGMFGIILLGAAAYGLYELYMLCSYMMGAKRGTAKTGGFTNDAARSSDSPSSTGSATAVTNRSRNPHDESHGRRNR